MPGLHYPCSSRPIQQFLVIYIFSFLEHSKYVVVVQLLLLPTWKVRDFGKGQKFVETSYLSLLIKGNFRIWYILPYLIIYDMKFTILMMFFEIFFFLSKGEQIRAFRDSTLTSSSGHKLGIFRVIDSRANAYQVFTDFCSPPHRPYYFLKLY